MTGIENSINFIVGGCILLTITVYVVFKIVLYVKKRDNKQRFETESGSIVGGEQTLGDNSPIQSTNLSIQGNGNQVIVGPKDSGEHKPATMGVRNDSQDSYLGVNILFIDDDKEYKIANILQKMGFRHVSVIYEIPSIELPEIKSAEVLFIDFNDVGREVFGEKEGLGAALAIKKRYPQKHVVLYSGSPHMYDNDLRMLDGVLPKNAAAEQFRASIEEFYKETHHEK